MQQQVKHFVHDILAGSAISHVLYRRQQPDNKFVCSETKKKSILFSTFRKQDTPNSHTIEASEKKITTETKTQASMIYGNRVRGGCPHLFR